MMNTRKLARMGIVAGLYAAVTIAIAPLSFGPIQFRFSEVMTLLPLISKEYIIALTIGCFVSNALMSTFGMLDIILGTLATFISVYLVYLTGKKLKNNKYQVLIASLWPTIINAIIIGGIVLPIFIKVPVGLTMLQVGFGQFVVITIIGVPLFKVLGDKLNKFFK